MTRRYGSSEDYEAPWPETFARRQRPPDDGEERLAEPHRETRLREVKSNAPAPERSREEDAERYVAAEPRQPSEDESAQNIAAEPEQSAEIAPSGFRPPRDEEVCWSLPSDTDMVSYPIVNDPDARPKEIWLYASGGGLRSPQATLGTAWYLDRVGHWKFVTRIISVSGGAVANAEFASRARSGATGSSPGRPRSFFADFHRRLTTPHRWALWLLIVVMIALTFVASYLLWKAPTASSWLVARPSVRWGLAVLAVGLALYALWRLVNRKLVMWFLVLGALAALLLITWQVSRWWTSLPPLVRWTLAIVAISGFLYVMWLLTGQAFQRWLLVVLAVAIGLGVGWYLVWERPTRLDWQWLVWIVSVLTLVFIVWLYLAAFQFGIRRLLVYRISRVLDNDRAVEPETLGEISNGLAHIFSTADYGSGHPAYLSAGPDNGATQAVVVHDLSSPVNVLHYYDARGISLRDAVYDSAALPGLVWLRARNRLRAFPPGQEPQITPVPGVWFFGNGQVAPPVPGLPPSSPDQPDEQTFTLMDGGLNSTLGTRLDPPLVGLIDTHGMMEVFDLLYPDANPVPPVANMDVRRVVVDSGQFLDESPALWTRVSAWLGISAIFTLARGINIANLSLLESDRHIADRPGLDVWYVAATGGDRTFRLRFTAGAVGRLVAQGRAGGGQTGDPLLDLVLDRGRLAWFGGGVQQPSLVGIAQTIDRVLLLKERTDRLSLVSGQAEYGYDAMASGVASAFVEHEGIDVDPVRLEKCLFDLDDQLLADAGNGIQFGTRLPLAISHQGLRPPGVRGNTAAAFWNALDNGFTMLEVDVMVTKDDVVVAVHPIDKPGNGVGIRVTTSSVRNTTYADLLPKINELAQLRHLLDPTNHVDDLFPSDPNRWAKAKKLSEAIWNIEAKDRHTSLAVVHLLNDLEASGRLPNPEQRIFFSGGWKVRPLRSFRKGHPEVVTACHWWEALRLALGFSADAPSVMQVPVVQPAAWWARPFVIRFLRRAVRQGRRRGKAILWFGVDHADEAILLRSTVPCHGFMTEGRHVLDWSRKF